MSLITDDLLQAVWQDAQTRTSDVLASADLWRHLWNKHLFAEKTFMASMQPPSKDGGRPRINLTIKGLVGANRGLAVLTFHEAETPTPRPEEVQELENQASDACERYLTQNPELRIVYAFTSLGTKGRAWRFDREEACLIPLFGSEDRANLSQYVELHSSEAELIRQAVETIKATQSDN
ncbi:hypothetical protein N7493_001831 [Penicillium malachiteum]|uniref:Uncharacterized protein n=1 Tax=Penicillium malachiteum TaxID=1324776 RepID=A0AAD6N0Q4_9EURO|nr:hypothetical protein N7493_001831 [Penicillium malachiteum]